MAPLTQFALMIRPARSLCGEALAHPGGHLVHLPGREELHAEAEQPFGDGERWRRRCDRRARHWSCSSGRAGLLMPFPRRRLGCGGSRGAPEQGMQQVLDRGRSHLCSLCSIGDAQRWPPQVPERPDRREVLQWPDDEVDGGE